MKALNLMRLEPLKKARIIAGEAGCDKKITGVNVLEALDIENWGKKGQVILTSFFAFKDLSEKTLTDFFKKMAIIGIAAIIVKVDRFVHHVPELMIELCHQHGILLIQIDKEVKYEAIVLAILEPIINKNVALLNRYYEIHSEITQIALKMPSIQAILEEFKQMIHFDFTLLNMLKKTQITTNADLSNYHILSKQAIKQEKYMFYSYKRREVIYTIGSEESKGSQISVQIPCLEHDEYELIIHEGTHHISEEDFMVLENAVKFLQMELLKKYALSQNIYQQKNNILNDVLNNRIQEEKDVDDILDYLNIDKYDYYQVAIVKLYQKEQVDTLQKDYTKLLKKMRYLLKVPTNRFAYMENTNRIVLLANLREVDQSLNEKKIKETVEQVMKGYKKDYYHISMSSVVHKEAIHRANTEALKTQKILDLFYPENSVLNYQQLGIYKLLLDLDKLDQAKSFISPHIVDFKEQHPELFETLSVFIDTQQSYTKTAERLFLHHKTIRYRIDKVKELLTINFDQPEDILQIQIATRLFKLLH
ncbi:purine catabolism regulatory protein [Halolactibacillus miurensis]|uniref:Purine catabolism regulatory protein n=1 Tax=Halolactibacillus miurensis TaxID=306541 RepID=A0A1I6P2X4_9BACI|nr:MULTISPECIES: PucR family transcriptional regulator [Halolactibacillus]GEM03151.1 purine catabolism regulatory protein [Halolactibacillus miurensis]SFS34554.1 purine catabolism regulatory protein [Halolactibacillus miurensis]